MLHSIYIHVTSSNVLLIYYAAIFGTGKRKDLFPCMQCNIERPAPYLGHEEALREEHDLTDLLEVWNDDHHWSEQSLHTLRELSSASIARVHGDEDAHPVIKGNLHPFKLFWWMSGVKEHGVNVVFEQRFY